MNNIEDLLKDKFENFEVNPTQDCWQNINNQVAKKSFFKFFPKRFNIYYLASIIIVSASIVAILNNENNKEISINSMFYSQKNITASQRKVLIENTIQEIKTNIDKNIESINNENNQSQNNIFISENSNNNSTINNFQNLNISEKKEIEEPEEQNFTAKFEIEYSLGCAPFNVKFKNLSTNIDYCVWNFGNGQTSYDYNTSTEYSNPGTYYITLKTVCGTKAKVYADSIKILPSPSANIAKTTAKIGFPFICEALNLENTTHIKWNFGDGISASGNKAAHEYKIEGVYNLELIISNQYCSDTISQSIEVTKPEYSINFPNAIIALSSGPSDGYDNNIKKSSVFIPKGDINQIERYYLEIFDNKGKSIFTSKDPYFGWNGYYNDKKLKAGVYVYKTSYTFTNGETYQKVGNITLIFGE
ncbi:MAG: PKD domain-containing protein [Bacteroidales bacterium]|nr:PKD domain-containing protein [Bacteroidales bacterium]